MTASPPATQQASNGARGNFAKISVGDIEVFALSDGQQDIPVSLFTDADPEEAVRLAAAAGFGPDAAPISINTFAVRTGGRVVLIDAGAGSSRGPHVGHTLESLRKAGLDPEKVQTVLLTHLHGDHSGGLRTADGQAAYPNAELMLAEAEADFWTDPGLPSRAPERMQPTIATAVASLAAYGARTTLFSPGREVMPGISSVPLPGHTPGQTGFMIESGSDRLFIWADIIHVEAFQFPHPEWVIGFDVDGAQAAKTRRETFERTASERLPIAGMHLRFPGLGTVVRQGDAFAYEPRAVG